MMGRQLEMVRLDAIRGNPENAKTHSVDGVTASMGRLGLVDIAVRDDRTGMLVAGHGRTDSLRARQTGGSPPEGVTIDCDGEWLVPVITGWASADDDEATAAAIALNAHVERGGWQVDRLIPILDRLQAGPGLDGIGYGPKDLKALLRQRGEEYDPTGAGGTARSEPGIGELAANYRNKQVRTIVLDYTLGEYDRMAVLAGHARQRHGVPGNAELFMALLRRWDAANPEKE